MKKSPVERLAARSHEAVCFTRGLDLPCWVFTGHRNAKGYSVIKASGGRSTNLGHRAAYLELIGPIPEGLEPDHLCRNRACWNPWHLDIVTHAINMKRSHAGVVVRARVAQITHCPQGHAYEGDNDRRRKNGWRYCLSCARDKREAMGAGPRNSTKTHCPQGHPYEGANLYVNSQGRRCCRECNRASSLKYKAKKAAARQ